MHSETARLDVSHEVGEKREKRLGGTGLTQRGTTVMERAFSTDQYTGRLGLNLWHGRQTL